MISMMTVTSLCISFRKKGDILPTHTTYCEIGYITADTAEDAVTSCHNNVASKVQKLGMNIKSGFTMGYHASDVMLDLNDLVTEGGIKINKERTTLVFDHSEGFSTKQLKSHAY